jgi:Glycosyltransferase family 87
MSSKERERGPAERAASSGLALLLLITGVVFTAGAVQKSFCANRPYAEERSGVSFQCYSDVGVLLFNEQLEHGRLPYLDPCRPAPLDCDEYPVVTMYVMRAAASIPGSGDPYVRFYWVNAALLLACALLTTYCLVRLGAKTEMFAAAPTLAIYGTMNWDLIPVALAAVATVAFFRRRDTGAGALLGIGAAAKIFPAFIVIAFVGQRLHDGDRRGASRLLLASAGAWLVLNLPFALAAPDGWWHFFRYSSDRPADHGTLWRVLCETPICPTTQAENVLSVAIIAGGGATIWYLLARRAPEFPRWTMAFPLLLLFFVASKVTSSQYILWLLPWFALTARAFAPYAIEQAAEVFVYLTIFSFFGTLQGEAGVSYAVVAVCLVVRALALIGCLTVWFRSSVGPGREAQSVITTSSITTSSTGRS